jgi:toxin ParE1/3/4
MKNLKLIISKQATVDLIDIWSYIALDNYEAADAFIDNLYASCKNLVNMPEIGRPRDELSLGLRCLPHKGYIIFYRIGNQRIEIIRVLNGCMDVDSVF